MANIERKSKQKVKGVAFNLDKPSDVEMLEYALSQGDFSEYVKRLIFMDMRLNGANNWSNVGGKGKVEETKKDPEPVTDDLDLDDLEGVADFID